MDTNNVNGELTIPVIDAPKQGEVPVKSNKFTRLLIILGGLFIFFLVGMGAYILTAKNTQQLRQDQAKYVTLSHSSTTHPAGSLSQPSSQQSIKFTSPKAGDVWNEGKTYDITWISSGVKNVSISAATGGHDLGHLVFSMDAALGKYTWTIPLGEVSGFGPSKSANITIKIEDAESSNIYDKSEITLTTSPQSSTPSSPSQPSSLIGSDIRNSILVYENNGIMLLNGFNSAPTNIDGRGVSPSYSPILQKIAYVNPGLNSDDNAIYVYDIPTKKYEELKYTVSDGTLNTVEWSPDGKYIVAISSTYVIGGETVYEYPSGRKITTITALLKIPPLFWDSDGNLIFRDPQGVTPPRQSGGGEEVGISKISLPSGQKQILLQANAQYDYDLMGVTNNLINYQPLDPNNPVETNKQIFSPTNCWQMDNNGQNNKLIDCKPIPEVRIIQINNIVSSHLPADLSGYVVMECIPNTKDPKWVVCSFYKSSTSPGGPSSKIGLFNLSQPQLGIKIVSDGNNPSW
jgi:hypothetical protein